LLAADLEGLVVLSAMLEVLVVVPEVLELELDFL
jgi:hypothetical protein